MKDSSPVKGFLRAADIGRSRSSILNQIQWTMAILIAGIVALQFARAASWLTVLFAALLSLHSVLFLIAFMYFMLKRPHSLRSESFDYKISELNLKREGDIDIKTSEFIQKRAGAIQAGLFEDVLDPSKLKRSSKPEDMKGPGKR
jgi:hypothetical protein